MILDLVYELINMTFNKLQVNTTKSMSLIQPQSQVCTESCVLGAYGGMRFLGIISVDIGRRCWTTVGPVLSPRA
jgi:hypothetical protein